MSGHALTRPALLRPLTRDDITSAMALKDVFGWNQTEADWDRFLAASPDGCFGAEMDGRLVGSATTIVYDKGLGWIGMMLVDPQYHRRGIGTALLERAVLYLDARHVAAVKLDATPLGKPLYEKFGFVHECAIERWVLKRTDETPLKPAAAEGIAAALRLDREIFGADRSGVLHTLAAEAPELVQVHRRDHDIAGYAFGRRGSRADQLGPWIAREPDVAALLLDEFLRRSGRARILVDCLPDHPWAIALLEARGFVFSRPLTRMVRGAPTSLQSQAVWGILGPEFG